MADPKDFNNKDFRKEFDETVRLVSDGLMSFSESINIAIKQTIQKTGNEVDKGVIKKLERGLNSAFKSIDTELGKIGNTQKEIIKGNKTLRQIKQRNAALDDKISKIEEKRLALQRYGVELSEEDTTRLKELYAEATNTAAAQEKFTKSIEDKAGALGEIFTRLSKTPIVGSLINASEATEAMKGHLASGGSLLGAMKKGAGAVVKGLGPLALLTTAFMAIKDLLFAADEQSTKVAKAFGVTKAQGQAIVKNLQNQNNYLTDTLYTTKDMIQAQQSLVDLQGAFTFSQGEQATNMATLTKKLHLAGDEAAYLNTLFTNQGLSTEEVFNNTNATAVATAKNNGYLISAQSIFQEIGKSSASILANFGNSGEELTRAVLQTRRLGVSLTQASNIANGLLDFEQSISAELEAELLTGKQFTFERARALAATGDIAGATEEVLRQTQNLTDEQLRSPIIQQSLAKATGLNADELVKSIQITRALNKATKQTQDLYKNAASQTEKIAIQEGILRGASFKDIKKNITAQEQFNNALENAKQQFSNLVNTGFLDMLTKLLPGALRMLAYITGQSDEFERNQRVQALMQQENSETGQKYTAEEAQGIMEAYESALSKRQNMQTLTRGKGTYMSQTMRDKLRATDEERAAYAQVSKIKVDDFQIKTNPKDTLVMAGGTQFGKETNGLLKQLISAVEGGKVINLEGRKVGETLVMSSYKS